MKNSKIEWTDHTFNPWVGCTRVSPGCQHCYAETLMADRYKKVKWGPQGARVRTSAAYWKQPLKWNREAEAAGVRRRVFCASLADVFEDKADQAYEMANWREELWNLVQATPWLDWLVLTKRPENVRPMVPFAMEGNPYSELAWPHNIWIGTSVENQQQADKRIPELLRIPAVVRFLSVEPLLGPVDLSNYQPFIQNDPRPYRRAAGILSGHISWVIVGGESGPDARPMHRDWARSVRDQCVEAGVPFFFKQNGEWLHWEDAPSDQPYSWLQKNGEMRRVGKKAAGRLLDGREWNEYPQVAVIQGQGA